VATTLMDRLRNARLVADVLGHANVSRCTYTPRPRNTSKPPPFSARRSDRRVSR
jgi:hypothetical protein